MTKVQWLHGQSTGWLCFKSRSSVPIAAPLALFAAFISIFLTLAILLTLDGKEVWPQDGIFRVVQPASCLSLILSFTSALIKFAFDEGVDCTWWVQYFKGANIATLAKLWSIGDSPLNIPTKVPDAHNRHYLAIPAFALLLLPWNGFILQGAILTEARHVSTPTTMKVPVVPHLDFGFTGGGQNDTTWSKTWGWIWQQAMDPAATRLSQYAYFGSRDWKNNNTIDFGYDQNSEYAATVPGAGFDVNCSHPELSYDMQPTAERRNTSGYIFNSSFSWNPSRPNDIELDVYWKESPSCIGQYNTTHCTLRAATVAYPIRAAMNVSNNPYQGPFYWLQHLDFGRLDPAIEILPVDSREGQNESWTYAGIRNTLASEYESSLEIHDFYNDTNFNQGYFNRTGSFAQILQPSGPDYAHYCNWSYTDGIAHVDKYRHLDSDTIDEMVERGGFPAQHVEKASPAYMIIDRLRVAMFLASVYLGSAPVQSYWANVTNEAFPLDHFIQTVPGIKTRIAIQYNTHLDVWIASVVITLVCILVVIPTFWSFWTLASKKDLNPVEAARALHAPVFRNTDINEDMSRVLSKVGHEEAKTARSHPSRPNV